MCKICRQFQPNFGILLLLKSSFQEFWVFLVDQKLDRKLNMAFLKTTFKD